jgi:DNA modification methylase
MNPCHETLSVTIYQGDALAVLAGLPSESVHCCVTSPPYWGLRDYGTATWEGGDAECAHENTAGTKTFGNPKFNQSRPSREATQTADHYYREECGKCGAKRIDSQLGLEATPEEYITRMVAVFHEVKRVLRADGTCWVNMGDSYHNGDKGGWNTKDSLREESPGIKWGAPHRMPQKGLKPKDLCGIPWMLAFALRADGWYLRSDIIWAKPNPMPESVTDRPTKSHEYLFLLSKSQSYYYDAEAIKEPASIGSVERWSGSGEGSKRKPGDKDLLRGENMAKPDTPFSQNNDFLENGRNKRTVWTVATQPTPDAHFATFPEELIKPCILAGTSEKGCCSRCGAPWERQVEPSEACAKNLGKGYHDHKFDGIQYGLRQSGGGPKSISAEYVTTGWQPTCTCAATVTRCTVLDPFFGSGTTGLVARMNGCKTIGIELNPAYIKIAAHRLRQEVFEFAETP